MNFFWKNIFWIFLAGFISGLIFCPFNLVRAVTVSPLRQVVTVDAGGGVDVFVEIENDTKQSVGFDLRVTGVKQGENGRPVIADGLDYAETWAVPSQKNLELSAGGKVNAYFHVQVPKGAEPRLHYLGLVVAPKIKKQSGMSVSPEIVSYLLIQVAGKVREQIQVVAWNLPSKVFFWPKKIPVNMTVRNVGATMVFVENTAEIIGFKNQEVLVSEKNSLSNVLPGAIRTDDLELDLVPVSGLGFGIYEVSSTMHFGYFGVQNLAHLRFFVISKTFFGVGLCVVLGLLFALFFWKRQH